MGRSRRLVSEQTIERDEGEIEITVEYTYEPGCPGQMYNRFGDPGDPPEPAEVDILSVTDNDGNKIELTDSERQRVEERLYEEGDNQYSEPDYD